MSVHFYSSNSVRIFLILFYVFLLATPAGFGQALLLERGTVIHQDAPRPCIRVQMEPEAKDVKQAWEAHLQDRYGIDLKGIGFLVNRDVLSAKSVDFPAVSTQEMDLYTQVVKRGAKTEMCAFALLDNGDYLDPRDHPGEYRRLMGIVEGFLASYLPEYYRELIDDTEDDLKDLIERREDLTNDIADNRQEIDRLTRENDQMSRELLDVEDQIEARNRLLVSQKDKLTEISRKIDIEIEQ